MTNSEAHKLIEECNNNKSKILDLTGLGLVAIPNKISDFLWLESLYLGSNQISEIRGLEKLVNLTVLHLGSNQISTITGLEKLVNLAGLGLESNQVSEIAGLDRLVNLTELYLNNNQVSEITGLDNLVNLKVLYLNNNQVNEITGLDNSVNLIGLNLSDNQISEIRGLDNLVNLRGLGLESNQVSEIAGLDNLVNLTGLGLNNNQVSEITGLDNLVNLKELFLNNNQISEIRGLDNLVNLIGLNLSDNQISEITGLDNLANLSELYLNNNKVRKIRGLDNLINLTGLRLESNQVSEITGLDNLANLTQLLLSDNQVSEIRGLDNLVNLTELFLSDNKLSEITGLDNLVNLTKLSISGNQISEIRGLDSLVNLTKLSISGNQIREVRGLDSFVNLIELYLNNNQLNEIRGLDSLVNLTELNLGDNKLSEISGLGNLVNLTALSLDSNQLIGISGLGNLVNLTELNLSDNEISEISGLGNLVNLTELNLSDNEISEISGLGNLVNLTALSLDSNQLIGISGLGNLVNLTELNLSDNEISEISGLGNLVNLTELNLSDNEISEISGLGNLVNLIALSLSYNKLSEISGLGKLVNLTELSLDSNQLIGISGLGNLVNLTELSISDNKLSEISGLENLVNLIELNLSDNKLSEISGLENLVNLIVLSLGSNQLKKISGLGNLVKLKVLRLDSNQLSEISGLENLVNLTRLYLSYNKISEIIGLENLVNLTVLCLDDNLISEITGLGNLVNLTDLSLYNNPLNEIYNLVLKNNENHWGIIKNIIERRAEEGKKNKFTLPAKILLLGNHASGKSSLLHYIQHENLDFSGNSTHLLKIVSYPVESSKFDAIFYDFGGQDYYHGIYRTFLSIGSAYLLLWDKDKDNNKVTSDSNQLLIQNHTINYWLGQKKHFEQINSAKSTDSVLLIQTHANEHGHPAYLKGSIHESIDKSFYVSLSKEYNPPKNEQALRYLKAEIDALIDAKKIIKEEQEWYVKFFEYVIKEENSQAIYLKQLLTKYTPENKTEYEALISLHYELEQFHHQGLVLYYPKINADLVWLNPSGLVQYIHDNVLQKEKLQKFGGIVPQNAFSECDPNIIELLKVQKVIFAHQWSDNVGIEYIIPNFLPLAENNEMDYNLFTFGLNTPSFVLKFKDFLPLGLINQLICSFGKQPDFKKFWRNQLLFTFEKKCKVLIRLDFENLKIIVYCSFKDNISSHEQDSINKYLFYSIKLIYWDLEVLKYKDFVEMCSFNNRSKSFNDTTLVDDENSFTKKIKNKFGASLIIKNTLLDYYLFEGKEYQPEDLYVSRDDKYFVNYIELCNYDAKETKIESHTIDENGLLSKKTKDIPIKPFKIFTNKKMVSMKNVFISYSKDDLSIVNRFRDALIPLHDEGIIESPWYCTFLEAGSNWDAKIQQKLKDADIVFFMCSMSFLRTKYIREHEIKTAIQAEKMIIPVIINFCEWDSYLGEYTALPYTSKPVIDFKNQDLAWLLVTKGIRWALETDVTKKEELGKQVRQLYERLVEGKLDA